MCFCKKKDAHIKFTGPSYAPVVSPPASSIRLAASAFPLSSAFHCRESLLYAHHNPRLLPSYLAALIFSDFAAV